MGVSCLDCGKEFSSKSTLNRHRKKVHGIKEINATEYDIDTYIYKCLEGCNISFKYNMDLRKHLEEKHDYPIEIVEQLFGTYDDFTEWLKMEEKNMNVRYEQTTAPKKRAESVVEKIYFACVRSGVIRGKQNIDAEDNLRKASKRRGSCKMDAACTSQIIVRKNTLSDECSMIYYSTHYGHEHDIQHLRLSKIAREDIATKLLMGASDDDIMQSLPDNLSEDVNRDDWITRKDIKNIRMSVINIKNQIKSTSLQVIENIEKQPQRIENLNYVLKSLKYAALLTSTFEVTNSNDEDESFPETSESNICESQNEEMEKETPLIKIEPKNDILSIDPTNTDIADNNEYFTVSKVVIIHPHNDHSYT